MNTCVWFDFGDTLLDFFRFDSDAGIAAVLQHLLGRAAQPAMLESTIHRSRYLNELFEERSRVSLLEYDQRVLHRLLYEPVVGSISDETQLEIARIYWDTAFGFRAQPGISEALDWLQQQGHPLGIISNASFPAAFLERELDRHGISCRFDIIVSTAEYGIRKPLPEIFRIADQLRRRTRRQQCDHWYFGNSLLNDVEGALAAGWKAVWYNRGGVSAAECPFSAGEIHSWGELPRILSTGGRA